MNTPSEGPAARTSKLPERCILTWRSDGLCQRMTSAINGLVIASEHNLDFRLAWPNTQSMKQRFNIDYTAPNDTPEDPCEIFAEAFLDKYFIEDEDIFYPPELVRNRVNTQTQLGREAIIMNTKADFNRAAELKKSTGLMFGFLRKTPRQDPFFGLAPNILNDELVPGYLARCRAVARSGIFAPEIEQLLQQSENMAELRDLWAVHLRSGDVVYGEVRKKFPRRMDFSISAPLATDFCNLAARADKKCLVVSASKPDLESVQNRCANAVFAEQIDLPHLPGPFAVIRDASLISQCGRIFSAEASAVVRLANYLGSAEWVTNVDIYSKPSETHVLKTGLRKSVHTRHTKLQRAFINYNLFVLNWDTAAFLELDGYLEKAFLCDRENLSYVVLRYLNCLAHSKYKRARKIRDKFSRLNGIEGRSLRIVRRNLKRNVGFYSKFMEAFLIHIYRQADLPDRECRMIGGWIEEKYSVSELATL